MGEGERREGGTALLSKIGGRRRVEEKGGDYVCYAHRMRNLRGPMTKVEGGEVAGSGVVI